MSGLSVWWPLVSKPHASVVCRLWRCLFPTSMIWSSCQSGVWARQGNSFGNSMSDVLASRAVGVTYTNSSGRHLFVLLSASSGDNAARYMYVYINGSPISNSKVTENNGTGYQRLNSTVSFIVPPGQTYAVSGSGTLNLYAWQEM